MKIPHQTQPIVRTKSMAKMIGVNGIFPNKEHDCWRCLRRCKGRGKGKFFCSALCITKCLGESAETIFDLIP